MRRAVSIILILDVVWLAATGILQIFPPFNKQVDPGHIIPVVIFIIFLSIHLWLNRKPVFKYFTGLGWKWIYITIGIIVILFGAVGIPVMMMGLK